MVRVLSQLTVSAGQCTALVAVELQSLLRMFLAQLELVLLGSFQNFPSLLRRQYLMVFSDFDSLVSDGASFAEPLFALFAEPAKIKRSLIVLTLKFHRRRRSVGFERSPKFASILRNNPLGQ